MITKYNAIKFIFVLCLLISWEGCQRRSENEVTKSDSLKPDSFARYHREIEKQLEMEQKPDSTETVVMDTVVFRRKRVLTSIQELLIKKYDYKSPDQLKKQSRDIIKITLFLRLIGMRARPIGSSPCIIPIKPLRFTTS
jgi:hypothetical protein